MDYATVIVWLLLGLGTAFLALLSFDEWKQENRVKETRPIKFKEVKKAA